MSDSQSILRLAADRPLTEPEGDQLGYAAFAKMIATSVLRGSPSDGLAVGVYGEWGLGKTTLLNFIEHYVKADVDDIDPLVIRFNPWWFSGREDLLRRFIKELEGVALTGRAKYGKIRDAAERLGNAVAVIPNAWTTSLGKLTATAARLGQPTDVVGLKKSLSDALKKEALRIIVLVDDIDRLPPQEMLDIFRLVKAVGDLPNVIYVLAFDREVVVRALHDAYKDFGGKYLDKIIQVTFELPRPGPSTIQRLFTTRLSEILGETPDDLFDSSYWSAIFLDGVMPFLRTPRDVARLLNAISVTYPAVRGEVNPTDFVAVETLRLFAPGVYDVIRSNPPTFVGLMAIMRAQRGEEDGAAQVHAAWLQQVPEMHQQPVRRLVSLMFPSVASLLGHRSYRSPNDRFERSQRRICAEEVFDIYFRYSLGPDLSRADFHDLIARVSDALTGDAALEAIATQRLPDGTTKLRQFVDMLRDAVAVGRVVDAPRLIRVLCTVGDLSIQQSSEEQRLLVADDLNVVYAVGDLLARVAAAERLALLEATLGFAGVSFVARLVVVLGRQHGRHGERPTNEEQPILASGELDSLEELARERCRAALRDGTFWRAPHIPLLIANARRLGIADDVLRKAVLEACNDGSTFLKLMTQLVHARTTARGGDVARQTRHFNLKFAASILDVDATAKRAAAVLTGHFPGLSAETREALELFVGECERAQRGERSSDED